LPLYRADIVGAGAGTPRPRPGLIRDHLKACWNS
jgi:hypothetical protein